VITIVTGTCRYISEFKKKDSCLINGFPRNLEAPVRPFSWSKPRGSLKANLLPERVNTLKAPFYDKLQLFRRR
jgi:hypothetical protein